MPVTPQDVLVLCREKDVKAVDLRYCDLLGQWQKMTIPVSRLSEATFDDGIGIEIRNFLDGSAAHDMLIVPQTETAFIDPFTTLPTLVLICMIQDPMTRDESPFDPRNIAKKSLNYLAATGIADQAFFGPECEFYIFESASFDQGPGGGYYYLNNADTSEIPGNQARRFPSISSALNHSAGASSLADRLADIRNEMMQTLIECGVEVESQNHHPGTMGQAKVGIKFGSLNRMGDVTMMYKYIVKNVARRHGKTATFMPKPLATAMGSGMHTHLSLWKSGEPLFAGSAYAGLSDVALYAIGGLLRHAGSVLAFTNPTSNSYRRLSAAGSANNLGYSSSDRAAVCRVPMYSPSPKTKRIEFRAPDPSCNPYLAFSAMLMAALDGIQNKIHPGGPTGRRETPFAGDSAEQPANAPRTLEESLAALADDHEFLLRGNVFTPEVIEQWIHRKRNDEVNVLQVLPHPYEFCMYYDC